MGQSPPDSESPPPLKRALFATAALALASTGALAQSAGPQPVPLPAPIPAPQDKPYPGLVTLSVDATDLDRRIFRVKETIPVAQPGPMTLLYPSWIPGNHAPRGPIDKLAGLVITGNDKPLEWTRDPVDVSAFHIDVPADVKFLELNFQYVSPTDPDQGRVVVTPEMMNVQWFALALYPAGHFTRQIQIEPAIRLPSGWDFATALETAAPGEVTRFKPVSFETLMDSPMFAGRYVKKLDLDPGGRSRVTLNVVADDPSLLEIKPAQLAAHRAMVAQADRLYGARHYDHYDFLFALSDRMGGIGVEHQRSSENGTAPRYFLDWDKLPVTRDLLPHEYTHSWNGKYRRPADLWTANFNTPMRNSLLWVYEGQTQYWGHVLAARAGLLSKQEALDALAATAATYDNRVGRAWRAMEDTTNDPIVGARRPQAWTSWQRSEDYYSEGQLIWLDADTLIREQTKGKKSLDDFAKAFFGVNDGDWGQLTYDFDEVVKTLNAVHPHDWAGFLKTRLEGHGPGAPLDGVTRGGYRLVYGETPTDYAKSNETRRKITDFTYSLGLTLGKDGDLTAVQWEGPAFKAGLADGMKLIAVDGLAYDPDRLKDAVTAAKGGKAPIELLVKSGERYRTVKIDYHGGLRYPRFERVAGTPARLDDILAPRK
ncbi:M61 family metallopeptidase [Phenylobacterium sp.]|uniref:M61 family metallopeptidase n=1 Tax=Phenylobacterium sp. TaxID=1871053 RepID=UPI0027258411|nr:peptidase M61 [Phenylobacterium sp.]MDO8378973.1 peptidase M61 [Phenylobacterium sp.]